MRKRERKKQREKHACSTAQQKIGCVRVGEGPYSRLNLRVDMRNQQPRNLVAYERERERNSISAILRDEVKQKEGSLTINK
jgi:hypothetical protein